MDQLLTKVLPLALGAAVSPTVLTIQVLILAMPSKPVRRAWAFTLGCLAVVIVLTVVGSKLMTTGAHPDGPDPVGATIKAVAALLLGVLAIRAVRGRGGITPKRMKKLNTTPTWGFLTVGVAIMALNFSSIILYIPALHEIAKDPDDPTAQAVATGILMLCTMAPALLPALAVTVLGSRAQPTLDRLNHVVTRYSKQINTTICVVFAAYLAIAAVQDALGR